MKAIEVGRIEHRVAATVNLASAAATVHEFLVRGEIAPEVLSAGVVLEMILDGLASRPDALPSRAGVTIHFTPGEFRLFVDRLEMAIRVASATRFKRQHVYELVSRALGFRSWNVLSGRLKKANISGSNDAIYAQAVRGTGNRAASEQRLIHRANEAHDQSMPADDGSRQGLYRSISGAPTHLAPVDALAVRVVFKPRSEN